MAQADIRPPISRRARSASARRDVGPRPAELFDEVGIGIAAAAGQPGPGRARSRSPNASGRLENVPIAPTSAAADEQGDERVDREVANPVVSVREWTNGAPVVAGHDDLALGDSPPEHADTEVDWSVRTHSRRRHR
jgi:hypothetical protein